MQTPSPIQALPRAFDSSDCRRGLLPARAEAHRILTMRVRAVGPSRPRGSSCGSFLGSYSLLGRVSHDFKTEGTVLAESVVFPFSVNLMP